MLTLSSLQDDLHLRIAVGCIILGLLVLILIASYMHAQRRVRKGLAPLPYHRWLVSSRQYPYGQAQNTHAYYQPNAGPYPPGQYGPAQTYPMSGYAAQQQQWHHPPPAYGQEQWDVPPVYQPPPAGASKINANQNISDMSRAENSGEGSSGVVMPMPVQHPVGRNDHVITQ